jgi:hypothetical protein
MELDLLDRKEMTLLEMQQAGYNIDPLVAHYRGDEVAIPIRIEDAAKTRRERTNGVPSYLSKSGWFKAALDFTEQQPQKITVSAAGLWWVLPCQCQIPFTGNTQQSRRSLNLRQLHTNRLLP